MKPIKLFIVWLLLGCIISTLPAATYTGAFDTNWFNIANWSTGVIPNLDDGLYHAFSTGAVCVISGEPNQAGSNRIRLPHNNLLVVQNGAKYSARDYLDVGFATNGNSSLLVKDGGIFSVRKLNVAVNGTGAKGSATFLNSTFMPFNEGGQDTNLFTCRDDGTAEATITFENSVLTATKHDGTPNRLILCLTVASQTSVSTMNVINSEIHVGRYATIGQSNRGILNMQSGTMTVGENLNLGNNSTDVRYQGYGELEMSDGSITAASIWVRTGKNQISKANVSGGLLKSVGTFGLQRNGTAHFSGTARVEAATFRLDAPSPAGMNPHCSLSGSATLVCNTLTISAGSIDLNDSATIVLNGDQRASVAAYVTQDKITAEGLGGRKVLVEYNSTTNQTIISVAPDEMLRKAYSPNPNSGAQVRRQLSGLSWQPGDEAINHTLYITTDAKQLANPGLAPVYSGDAIEYVFPGVLDAGTYYWRVDEYNGTIMTIGDVWFFTAAGIEIDDFDYADTDTLLAVWTAGTGAELAMVSDATQVNLNYDNKSFPYYSEVTRIPPFADFTAYDLKSLDISFFGNGFNSAEPVYVTLSDGTITATVQCPAPMTSAQPVWQTWRIALAEFTQANASLDLTNIQAISFGIGDKNNPQAGGEGTVTFDDILLFEPRCLDNSVYGDLNGDCRVNLDDFGVLAKQWQDNNLWPEE